jgi:hypothetical protein
LAKAHTPWISLLSHLLDLRHQFFLGTPSGTKAGISHLDRNTSTA